jgi:hypothetical protein
MNLRRDWRSRASWRSSVTPTSLAGNLAAVATAEQGCCAFFDFTLHLTPDAIHLNVRAPESAAQMLADLWGAPA